jgi:hypothetical protein
VLTFGKILEPMLADVAERDVGRHHRADERSRRLRDEDLPSMGGRGDAGGSVHVDPDVVAAGDRGLSGVHAHPHLHFDVVRPRLVTECALRRDRRLHRGHGRSEHHEEGVAFGRGDVSVADRLAQQPVMIVEQRVVRGTELLEQLGRSLDVGEQEGDGARGRVARRAQRKITPLARASG